MEQRNFFTWINSIKVDENWINAEFYRPEIIKVEDKFIKNKNLNIFRLNQITDVNRVTGFEVEKYLKIVDEGIPYLRVKNIDECFINFEDMQFIPKEVHEKFNKSKFKANDIALTITGRVGTAAIISGNMEFNACQDVVKISIKQVANVNPYYLVIYLNTKYNYMLLNRFNSGGSRPRTLINNVREVNIPIPSPEIQKYIGDKVRKAEKLREEAKRLKREAEEILNKNLKINELVENLKLNKRSYNWISKDLILTRLDSEYYNIDYLLMKQHLKSLNVNLLKLSDISIFIEGGYNPKKNEIEKNRGIPLIQISDIEGLVININNDYGFVRDFKSKFSNSLAKYDEILFSTRGSVECLVNRIGIYLEQEDALVTGNVAKCKLKNGYFPKYVLLVLKSIIGDIQIKRNSWGIAQKGLTCTDIGMIEIPLIDEKFQIEISDLLTNSYLKIKESKKLIQEAKQDVEDLIEGNFDMSKVKANN